MPLPLPRSNRLQRLCALGVLLLPAPATLATAPVDPVALAVQDFLTRAAAGPERQVTVEVTPIAAQLPPCDQPQPFLPQSTQRLLGRVAVGVHCAGGATRYRQATVAISAAYPVTLRAMAAGEVLSADLLELRHGDLGSLPRNAVLDAEQAIGRELTRALGAGSPLPANALRRVPLVARGARVRIEARTGSFVASREGTALDSGGQGEEVRIRTESGAILRARVQGRNLLTVDF
jgi:flagella basal body P-ring formation protein FlgA